MAAALQIFFRSLRNTYRQVGLLSKTNLFSPRKKLFHFQYSKWIVFHLAKGFLCLGLSPACFFLLFPLLSCVFLAIGLLNEPSQEKYSACGLYPLCAGFLLKAILEFQCFFW